MPKVMVLEDEPTLYLLLQELLGLEGYEVSRPRVFSNLLEEMRGVLPDAILMDVNLPNANGLDLLDQIRGDAQLKDSYVLLTSGLDYREESLRRGANEFLMKPYMPDELVNLLKEQVKH
jgi:DNA-binding response OmpR family regulator